MARIPTSHAGIARAALFSALAVAAGNGATHSRMLDILADHGDGFAAATGSALGGGVKARLTRYMAMSQGNRCILCRRPLNYSTEGIRNGSNGHANALPRLFTLIPSVAGSDVDIADVAAGRCGMAPGNVVLSCKGCCDARNALMSATREFVAVTEILPAHVSEVLLSWPKGTDRGRERDDVAASFGEDSHLAKSIRTRVANYGF